MSEDNIDNKSLSNKMRPLSPHLFIYKWQMSSVLSILHRFATIGTYIGFSIIVLLFALYGFKIYDSYIITFTSTYLFKLGISAFIFVWMFFFFTNLRYLLWDFGFGFSLETMHFTGYISVILSVITSLYLIYLIF